jgi:hypothetical protein
MTPERRKCAVRKAPQIRPFLDNGSVNTFPRLRYQQWKDLSAATEKHGIVEEPLGVVVCIRFAPNL